MGKENIVMQPNWARSELTRYRELSAKAEFTDEEEVEFGDLERKLEIQEEADLAARDRTYDAIDREDMGDIVRECIDLGMTNKTS